MGNKWEVKHLVIGVLVALGLIAAIIVVGWHLFAWLPNLPYEYLPILTVVISAAVSLIAVTIAKRLERRHSVELELRKQKERVYRKFTEHFSKMMLVQKSGASESLMKEIDDFMADFIQGIMMWGADEVVVQVFKFRQMAFEYTSQKQQAQDDHGMGFLLNYEDVFKAMRKDMGHMNTGIKPGMLLGLFVLDIYKHFPQLRNL